MKNCINRRLIDQIIEACPIGRYKVLSLERLAEFCGEDTTVQSVIADIEYLKDREFLIVKFCDSKEVCLSVTIKAISFVESTEQKSDAIPNVSQHKKYFTWAFLGAFTCNLFCFIGYTICKYAFG